MIRDASRPGTDDPPGVQRILDRLAGTPDADRLTLAVVLGTRTLGIDAVRGIEGSHGYR